LIQTQFIFSTANVKAEIAQDAKSGFGRKGIWPIYPQVLDERFFAPAETKTCQWNAFVALLTLKLLKG
jgi:hypothetical protein